MKKKMLPVIIIVVLVVVAFGVYWFVLRPQMQPQQSEPTTYELLSDMVYYSPGDYFVTNITGSTALAKTSVSIALSEDESEFLGTNNAVVRNAIVKVLISHPEQEMRAATAIDMLEQEMAQSLRDATGLETIDRVLISDFVIQ